MRVALVIGDCPPGGCGVGDFSYSLAEALRKLGVSVQIVAAKKWGLVDAWKVSRSSQISNADIVHIQYPTLGFGSKLGPQLLSLISPAVITLHEISRVHALRKLSLLAFSVRSKEIVFTTEYERHFALGYLPWLADHSQVIPIGNSVGIRRLERAATTEIVSFGLIRPDKGIEQVIQLARLVRQASLPFTVRIIGRAHSNHLEYVEQLRAESAGLPIIWDCNRNDEEVSYLLANAMIAYLPFPDGASERRSTLMTLLANEVTVVTTRGRFTPKNLEGVVRFAADPSEALGVIQVLLQHPEEQQQLARKSKEYMRSFSWDRIANLHVQLYRELLPKQKAANLNSA